MSGLPRPCPSCGGACGYTPRTGCRYKGGVTKDDQIAALRRDLFDARALVHGAVHLLARNTEAAEFTRRAERWLSDQAKGK